MVMVALEPVPDGDLPEVAMLLRIFSTLVADSEVQPYQV
jgi:hypothetical protein